MAGDLFEVVEPRQGGAGAETRSVGSAGETRSGGAGGEATSARASGGHPAAASDQGTGGGETIVLRVHVQPGAGRSSVVGRYGSSLHLRVAAPPVDGRATAATAELVRLLDVPKSSVTLVSGDRSREKRFMIKDVDLDAVRDLIDRALEDAAERSGARSAPHPPKSRRPG